MPSPTRANFWPLLAGQCVLTSGLALSYPFFALYLHRVRGLPMGLVGAVLFAMLCVSMIAQLMSGELSDILGPKRVMEASVGARALMAVLMAWAMYRQAPVAWVVILQILGGFTGSFFDSAVSCWIASAFPAPERLVGYGRLRVAVNLGWAVGPAVGGMLALRSYPLLFALTGAACLLCLALMHATVPEVPRLRPESRFSWRATLSVRADRRFVRHCGNAFLIALVISQLVACLPVHAIRYAGLGEAGVGLLFTLNGLVVVLTQTPVSERARRMRLTSSLAAGCLLYSAGYGWVGFAEGFASLAAAVVLVTLGEVMVSPALQTMAANLAPEEMRGRYLGFQSLALQLGAAFGPLLGGLGLQVLSPRWSAAPWLAVAAVGAAAAFGFRSFGLRLGPAEDGTFDPQLSRSKGAS